ncbi:MAG TPA: M13 family metallopeptidase [Gemmatimonadaceae bacterium]
MIPLRRIIAHLAALGVAAGLLPVPTHAQAARSVRVADMQKDCPACKDFYTYANGAWMKRTKIPNQYPEYGGYYEAYDRNRDALRRILTTAAASRATTKDANERRIGEFYASCMDSAMANRTTWTPLKPLLDSIDATRTPADIMNAIAMLHRYGVQAAFAMMYEMDPKSSDLTIGQLYQGGLGLPNRGYYIKTDPQSDSLRRAYVRHVARTLELGGGPTGALATDAAKRVLALETSLANASMTLVEQRDPQAIYHKVYVADLDTIAPGVNWPAYFAHIGASTLSSRSAQLDVSQPKFMAHVAQTLTSMPIADWRAYLRWQLLANTQTMLGDAMSAEAFAFNRVMSGEKEPRARWRRCVARTDVALGEALGQAYVAKEFSPASKRRMLELVANLQAVFDERIASSTWMTEPTKKRAQAKLAAFSKKIAYPEVWRDYSALSVSGDRPFVLNLLDGQAFEAQRGFAKINKPTDRKEWDTTVPTVNAYYNPLNNDLTFPAGILMPPFFDPKAEDAVNYGGIGMVIGHEMTHGFDDQGRQYDPQGNLSDWWTPADAEGFNDRAEQVVKQYDAYVPIDTLHVNGRQTLGENLADIGGLTLAYYAYERSLNGKPRPPVIDGFTPEQRFFLGFAQASHSVLTPEFARMRVSIDVHSPDMWRVNGAVSAMPEFAAAFGCKEGDSMVRLNAAATRIW